MPPPAPWTVDVILPEQWELIFSLFDPDRVLRVAILESAVKDIRLPHGSRHCLGCDAVSWMLGNTGWGALSFGDVCEALSLDPTAVFGALRPQLGPHLRPFTISLRTLRFSANASRAVPA